MKLNNYFPYLLASTAESFSRILLQVYGRSHGLSREEWRFLFLLADAKQLNSRELAVRTTLDKVQVSRAATRLEQKGLIVRSIDKNDRRLRRFVCTLKGQQLFAQILPELDKKADQILDAIDPEDLKALKQGLIALRQAVSEVRS